MTYPKIPLAQTVIQLCKAKNIKHIIISPGSRSAPLTIGFTHDPFFKCYSIVDERSAAFFALGIAQKLQETTALVCTSGSAVLNYYPAIAEAYYSQIPLLVLSADRPEHLINIGDGQTINQKNVFKNHIIYATNLKLEDSHNNFHYQASKVPFFKTFKNKLNRFFGLHNKPQAFNNNEINKAINLGTLQNGPVHINIPFDEPLYETVDTLSVLPEICVPALKTKSIKNKIVSTCIKDWNKANKKMILVGVNHPNTIAKKWLDNLASDPSVIVFTETTSNLHHPDFFPCIDQIIAPLSIDEQKELQPDILLTFGGLIVSKKIKQLLRKFKPDKHWHVGGERANDTFFSLSQHLKTSPDLFFEAFLPQITQNTKSPYQLFWKSVKNKRLKKHQSYLDKMVFSDFKAFDFILKSIPHNYILQVGNSSAIRYTQLFELNETLEVFCNRGTSGIDGSTSTAIGSAVVSPKPTLFITGDLSFLYDSNALWNNYIPHNFRIIVVNNSGGGIFRILPGQKNTDNFDTFFETHHKHTAKHLSMMYGFKYEFASDVESLNKVLKTFYNEENQPKLLEVFTPKNTNDTILLDYFNYIN